MIGFIYYIINNTTGKRYVGITTDYKRRWNKHRSELQRNKHHSSKLQNAWNKYGEEDFIWFKKQIEIKKYEDLLELEKQEIAFYNSYNEGYNCTIGGELPPLRQKVKDENIVDYLCILNYYGEGYGKTCEEIFGWSKGTASTAKRKVRFLKANSMFDKLTQTEKQERAKLVFEKYKIAEIALSRQLEQGGSIRVYQLNKDDYYFAFAAKELGYTSKAIAQYLQVKEGTVKDWGRRHRLKELNDFNNLPQKEKEKIFGRVKTAELSGNPKS